MNWKFWQKKQTATEACVTNALKRLGANVDTIAATLEEKEIFGFEGSTGYCPIANYLKKECNLRHVSVGYSSVKIYLDGALSFEEPLLVKLPKPAGQFARDFDKGKFPALAD